MSKLNIAVITGAGISVESGLSTFRGAGGLWEGYDIHVVASAEGWRKDPALVLDFYNKRRKQAQDAQPNKAHLLLAELEKLAEVTIITQNVDDLHEKAGSSQIIHLHGQLNKVRSVKNSRYVLHCEEDIELGRCCPKGGQLRPDIVWFGEAVPRIEPAARVVSRADLVLIVGTSLQVYPAAGLVLEASPRAAIWYIDPDPGEDLIPYFGDRLQLVRKTASEGMLDFLNWISERSEP